MPHSIRLGFSTLVLFGALLAGGTAAEGQPSAPRPRIEDRMRGLRDEAPALLQSADPRDQAWGAWLAGVHGMRELQPLLEVFVASHLASDEPSAPLDLALDALIQMDAKLPPDLLAQVFERRPDEALVLLSHLDAAADPLLLSLLEREQGLVWFGIANLMLERKPAGLAKALIVGIEIEARLTVSDDGGTISGGGHGIGIGCDAAAIAPGMPPWASYKLSPLASAGAILLATGPKPIYYERRVSRAGEGRYAGGLFVEGPSGGDRLDYIAALGNFHSDLPLSRYEHRSVAWHGQAALSRDIEAFREDMQARYARLLQMLVGAALLTEEEAATLPATVKIGVNDARESR